MLHGIHSNRRSGVVQLMLTASLLLLFLSRHRTHIIVHVSLLLFLLLLLHHTLLTPIGIRIGRHILIFVTLLLLIIHWQHAIQLALAIPLLLHLPLVVDAVLFLIERRLNLALHKLHFLLILCFVSHQILKEIACELLAITSDGIVRFLHFLALRVEIGRMRRRQRRRRQRLAMALSLGPHAEEVSDVAHFLLDIDVFHQLCVQLERARFAVLTVVVALHERLQLLEVVVVDVFEIRCVLQRRRRH
mmetsp:Transcript_8176/g.13352  ORF Transcript_8176/g.13352 Transcript_8176/m.13352 type:complete len:246 (-) Transcript_8176:447-1184(-)